MAKRRNSLSATILLLVLMPALCFAVVQTQKFSTVDGFDSSHFGRDIALSDDGTFAIVQAPNANSAYAFNRVSGTWVESGPIDGWGKDVVAISRDGTTALVGGSVYTRDGTSWVFQQDLSSTQLFSAVALSADGNTAVCGDPSVSGPGVYNYNVGKAFVYTRSASTWTLEGELVASDGLKSDMFSGTLSISDDGNTILAGARGVDVDTTNYDVGAAYIFTRSGATWTEQQKLMASDYIPNMYYSHAVALSPDGKSAMVGAPQNIKVGNYSKGCVYVYGLSGGIWTQTQQILSPDIDVIDWAFFGGDLAFTADGNKVLIGDANVDARMGAAYLFTKVAETWGEQEKISPDNGVASDKFGWKVAISGTGATILVGAWRADFGATDSQGVVYAFSDTPGADSTAPTVSLTDPVAGATDTPTSSTVTATFDEAMDAATLDGTSFTVTGAGGAAVTGAVSYNAMVATFTPTALLAPNTLHEATITTGATDIAGNSLAADHVWTFTTGAAADTTNPTVQSASPAAGATAVALNAAVTATFDEAMDVATVTASTFTVADAGGELSGTVIYDAGSRTATFTPAWDLDPETAHTATVTTGASDVAGNGLAASHVWTFTTGTAPDTTSPTVDTTSPADAATGVAVNTAVTATFDEAMDAATLTTATLTLSSPSGSVTGAVSYAAETTTVTFIPSAALLGGTAYTATVTSGVTDASGNPLGADYQWSFTTIPDDQDSDGDGVPDNQDEGPLDPTHATPQATTGTGMIEVHSGDSGGQNFTTLANVRTVSPSDPSLNQTGRPADMTFPDGLVAFTVEGVLDANPVTMQIWFPTPFPEGAVYYKVDSNGFHAYPHAVFSGGMVTIDLFDNGQNGDLVAGDGVIQDPGGVAVPNASSHDDDDKWWQGGCFLQALE